MTFAGDEVINVARTKAYVDAGYAPAGARIEVCDDCDLLPEMLGETGPYSSPMIDDAPWVETSNPDSWDFAGIIPLEITGASGSTRTVATTELSTDGGVASRVRYAGRTIAVTALLVGKTGCAVESGLSWLSTVLNGTSCSGPRQQGPAGACSGDEMCMFTCCPGSLDETPVEGEYVTEQINLLDPGWRTISGLWQPIIPDSDGGKFTPVEIPVGIVTNLVSNPSFEVDASAWQAQQGTLSRVSDAWGSRVGDWSGLIISGAALTEVVNATAVVDGSTVTLGATGTGTVANPTVEEVLAGPVSVNGSTVTLAGSGLKVPGPGQNVTFGPTTAYPVQPGQLVDWVTTIGARDHAIGVQSSLQFYNAASALISTVNGNLTEIRANSYGNTRVSINAPLNATTVKVVMTVVRPDADGGGAPVAGTGIYVDAAAMYIGLKAAGRGYFDGDSRDSALIDYAWTGTPGLSTSTATPVGAQPELDAPPQECAEESVFTWNVSTVSGEVRVIPAAKNAETGGFVWYGAPVTVHGQNPVSHPADQAWGDWIPVLLVDTAPGAQPFIVQPSITHARYTTPEECAANLMRSYLDVTTTSGPTVVEKIIFNCGEYALKVEWTMFVGNPFLYGPEKVLAQRVYTQDGQPHATPTKPAGLASGVQSGNYGEVRWLETACANPDDKVFASISTLSDPDCPGYITPPAVPSITETCLYSPDNYQRTVISVPAMYAPGNDEGTLNLVLANDVKPKRGLRIRIYPDATGDGFVGLENCDFCEEFTVTYLPGNAVMTINGVTRRITTRPAGSNQEISTSASVRGPNGGPFDFPSLLCNMGYLVIIDNPLPPTPVPAKPKSAGDLWVDVAMRTATG